MDSIRYHYMDNLRAIAMLIGIFFHAAVAYLPNMQNLWLAANPDTSQIMDIGAWFLHLFRMPLFFLIAGFFAAYLVSKRGISGLMKNRALRILLPFIIFLPLIYLTLIAPISWAIKHVENPSPMLQLIAFMATQPDAPQPPPSTTHLWFIYNLFMFCVVYSLLVRFAKPLSQLADRHVNARFLVFVLPLLMVPAMATQIEPHPAPEQFVPRLWSFGYFGLFFLVGSFYYRRQSLLDDLRPYLPLMLIGSVLMYVYYYLQLPGTLTLEEAMATANGAELNARQVGISALEAFMSVHLTLASLVLGKQYLDKANATIRFIADSSYWVYIMHLPTLIFIQYLLLDTHWNVWLEFGISSLGTIPLGMITYVALIRWTPIGWMLNGRRSKRLITAEAA